MNFIIVTDTFVSDPLPTNIKIVHKSFADVKSLASEKLGFEIELDSPYKLCDFKPAYGLIFSEYLKGFDF